MTNSKKEAVLMRGYALGRQEVTSLNNAVRNLAEHVNEHTVLLHALIKKLGTTPEELINSLDERDFVNDADLPKDADVAGNQN
jgi:hypothetical protein